MRDTDLIHALTFDFAFAAMPTDSVELADWVKADLLPVIEEVLDQYRAMGRRRIERLEIDLGTVPAAQAPGELARRLFMQLSSALEDALDHAGAAGQAGDRTGQGQGGDMLDFLRSGTVPWTAAYDANAAHKHMLRQLIDSPQAHEVLGAALREAAMLTRLIRQFDAHELMAVAGALFSAWAEPERGAALAWAAEALRRRQDAGDEVESFWRWFLPQYANPVGPETLLARWTAACEGEPAAEPQAMPQPSSVAVSYLSADAMRCLEQGLENADFAVMAPFWDRGLVAAPSSLRAAHPQLWKRWLQEFDADTLADMLGLLQADCSWLIERLATVVPRSRLNALLRPALQQWLAAPVDSLAPHVVLEWFTAALPEQRERMLALFAADDGAQAAQAAQAGAPAHTAIGAIVGLPDTPMPAGAADRFQPSPQARTRLAAITGAGFTAADMLTIEQALETADFALLAPYWDRVLTHAPQWLRSAHARQWEQWLLHADDATLTDILGVVQADCARLIDALETVVPRPRLSALLRPAMQQWLAEPVDGLAPHMVLEWVKAALPEQRERILALFAADGGGAGTQESEAAHNASSAMIRPADAQVAAGGDDFVGASPQTQARLAAMAGAGFTASDMRAIEHALETADFTMLAPYWDRVLTHAPQWLRSAHARQWEQWLRHADDATLTDILGVVQADCAWLIDALAAVVPRPRLSALLRPAMQQWLAEPVDSLAPHVVLEWVKAALPDQSDRMLAFLAPENAAPEPPSGVPVAGASGNMLRQSDAQLLSNARVLLRRWPRPRRDAVLARAAAEVMRLREAGSDSIDFWRWFLPRCADPIALSTLGQQWSGADDRAPDTGAAPLPGQAPFDQHEQTAAAPAEALGPAADDAPAPGALAILPAREDAGPGLQSDAANRAYERLRAALREPRALADLVRHLDARQLLAAARLLFQAWPPAQCDAVLAWAAQQQQRLHDAGADVQSFWCWFLPQYTHPSALDTVIRSYTNWLGADVPAQLFAPDEAANIQQGLATAQFQLLAPHWVRLLQCAPQWICAEHPKRWRTWLATFDDDVLMDILSVVQPGCKPMMEAMSAVVPRERLLHLTGPALPDWLGAAPHRLSPRVMLMHVMKATPQHAEALSALFYAQEPGERRAAPDRHAAVDSQHFREPLRVLGSLFSRAEIITISRCLNAGQFAPLAPYWDRLLVLAPHWLRSEYPRLARKWLDGFDDEVLIDILSVVQAECCVLIEQLASALPRAQLHAALRPSLARWFALGLDRLAPQAIMDAVLRAAPGLPAALRVPYAPAQLPLDRVEADADPFCLEAVLQRGDAARLRCILPSVVMSQRARFRRIWQQMPAASRVRAVERCTSELSLAQQIDVAVMLQPAAARLMAELQRFLGEHPHGRAILGSALTFLLQAEVSSAEPARLMQSMLEQHPSLPADLPLAETRHIAAALQLVDSAPAQPAPIAPPEEPGDALASASRSEAALRAYAADCLRGAVPFGRLNSAQLHGLVQAWARFQQAGRASGAFLPAVEAQALRVAKPHAFFGKVLQHAMLGEPIDLDEIGAGCGAIAPAPLVQPLHFEDIAQRRPAGESPGTPAQSAVTPLSDLQCRALPQRLADALLRADLSALEAIWPNIVMHHPALLKQAAQRYLGSAAARQRLIGSADPGKMQDLLGCLSEWTAQLVAPLLANAAPFSQTLPTPLAPAAFEQRLLRFAFTQALERPISAAPAELIFGLLGSVLPAQSPQSQAGIVPVAHAWYELLRGGESPLKAALERTLFGRAYLAVALRRLRTGAHAGLETPLPDVLLHMLTIELCTHHPALTDQLLADGTLTEANATVFCAAEWQALARAQLPRQEPEVQLAFRRTLRARLPVAAPDGEMDEEAVQAAYAVACGVFKTEPRDAVDAAGPVRVPADAALASTSADTLAILLMRASAPDDAVNAAITLLIQRLLANAGACAGTTAYAALQSALSHHPALERLLGVVPGPTLAHLLCVLQPNLAGALPAVLRVISDIVPIPLSTVPAMLDSRIWRAIFDAVFIGRVPAGAGALLGALVERLAGEHPREGAAWVALLETQDPAATAATPATPAGAMALLLQPLAGPQPGKAAATAKRTDEDPVPLTGDANLRNAGLVIIAPYIERLFALLDITRDGVFVSDDARQRGVHLLQYVITAEESTPEYLLALNKLLCGIPAAVPVALGISMTDKEKDTIDQMLKGVIAHWSAIGASSVTGLRETFLQREGCLYYQEEAWHLKVPQRTFDMLLDRLPWSYKLIKFSWMAAPLNVTWR